MQQEAAALTVRDDAECESAWAFVRRAKALLAQIDAAFDPLIAQAHASHKAALAQKKKYATTPESLVRLVNSRITAYRSEQERQREAEERRLRELARRDEEERRLAAAIDLEADGRKAEAAELLEQPVETPVVMLAPVAKPDGMRTRVNWKFRIADATLLPREYLIPDEVKIGQVVRAMREQHGIPGVEAYSEESIF
jgi:hypothetical protein